jgi:L-2,4-diaminobutyrate transaminase
MEQRTDEFGAIGHGWTLSAHPIGAAAGVANLNLIDKLGLVANAGAIGAHFNQGMNDAIGQHKNVVDVRGEGLLCAVELVEDKEDRVFHDPAKKIEPSVAAALLKRGVIARAMPQGGIIGFAPPLCLSREEADTIIAASADAVMEVCG